MAEKKQPLLIDDLSTPKNKKLKAMAQELAQTANQKICLFLLPNYSLY